MMHSKVAAMKRIADDTERCGGSDFPRFMESNMKQWEREGLVKITYDSIGYRATITEKGRELAKKAM